MDLRDDGYIDTIYGMKYCNRIIELRQVKLARLHTRSM